jgi:hypothetical protein
MGGAPALGGNVTKLGLAGGGTPAAAAVAAVELPARHAWREAPASWAAPASSLAGQVTGRRRRLADGSARWRGGAGRGVELRDAAALHAWNATSHVSSQLGAATKAVKSAKTVSC